MRHRTSVQRCCAAVAASARGRSTARSAVHCDGPPGPLARLGTTTTGRCSRSPTSSRSHRRCRAHTASPSFAAPRPSCSPSMDSQWWAVADHSGEGQARDHVAGGGDAHRLGDSQLVASRAVSATHAAARAAARNVVRDVRRSAHTSSASARSLALSRGRLPGRLRLLGLLGRRTLPTLRLEPASEAGPAQGEEPRQHTPASSTRGPGCAFSRPYQCPAPRPLACSPPSPWHFGPGPGSGPAAGRDLQSRPGGGWIIRVRARLSCGTRNAPFA